MRQTSIKRVTKSTYLPINVENPMLITVSLNLMSTLLNPSIEFKGSHYTLFAVAYTNGGHFMARIQIVDSVYEYDGMCHHSLLCRALNTRRKWRGIKKNV